MFYKDLKEYGSPIDCYWKSSDTIQMKVTNKPDGWTVHTSDEKVSACTHSTVSISGWNITICTLFHKSLKNILLVLMTTIQRQSCRGKHVKQQPA